MTNPFENAGDPLAELAHERGCFASYLKYTRHKDSASLSYGSEKAAGLDIAANLAMLLGTLREQELSTTLCSADSIPLAGHILTLSMARRVAPEWNPEENVKDLMIHISPGDRVLIPTGISATAPAGTYIRVAPRSGLSYKKGLHVMAGVVDEDYTGDIGVILYNSGCETVCIKHGDRVAQLVVEEIRPCLPVEVESLVDSSRGTGGFGSTGA